MLFFEPPVVDGSQFRRNSVYLTNALSSGGLNIHGSPPSQRGPPYDEVRWSPPSNRRASKFCDGAPPPFCSSRFLSSSPPLTRNKQNFDSNTLTDTGHGRSSLILHKRQNNDHKGKHLLDKNMERHSNSTNDDASRPPNSLQLYKGDQERGVAGVGSPHEVRREFGMCPTSNPGMQVMTAMPSHIPPAGYTIGPPPPGTKVLIDPTTGQQYFVPTAQPHVAYYPVFYNAAPPPQSQPLFYQAAPTPTGYFVPSQQHMPSSPTHHSSTQPMFFHQPQHDPAKVPQYSQTVTPSSSGVSYSHSQNYGSPPYRVEIPPSNASVASSHFQRNHESRVSMESGASSASGSSRNKHSDDSVSPALRDNSHSYRQPQTQNTPTTTKLFPDNWLHNSARYSSATSSSSGFYSGDVMMEKSHLSTRLSGTSEVQDSPTYQHELQSKQQQQYWNIDSLKNAQRPRKEKDISSPMHRPQNRESSASPNVIESPRQPPPPKPTQKAIRMDIDLSQPFVAEKALEKTIVKANVTPSTAFTISFDDSGSVDDEFRKDILVKSPKKTPLSLQDAARQAPTGRRLMRRNTPKPTAEQSYQEAEMNVSRQNPKEYLFSKMFEHPAERNNSSIRDSTLTVSGISSFDSKREIDAASEAGTYVVEKESKMVTSQVLDSDEEDSSSVNSSSTSTVISDSGSNRQDTPRLQLLQKPTAIRATNSSSVLTNLQQKPSVSAATFQRKSPPSARRSLMSDLRKLREEKTLNSARGISPTSPRGLPTAKPTKPTTGSGFLPSISNPSKTGNAPTRLCQSRFSTGAGTAGANAFRRADGGRFSMRSGASSSSGATTGRTLNLQARPPFRTGNAAKPTNKPQETPEMVAWLRRKEYDPRKAAAEARKVQQLKQSLMKLASGYDKVLEVELVGPRNTKTDISSPSKRLEETYLASRSLSYNNAGRFLSSANSAFQQWQKPLGDDRSNKSFDNLSRLGEESGIDEFAQLSIAETSSNLKKTVDALTEKCNKSIELIKFCSKNALSPSVENLLQSVVESSSLAEESVCDEEEDSAKISNRLERLNSAFDAIQKYLEEQSSSSNTAPSKKLLGLIPSAASTNRPSGSSTQRLLLDITELTSGNNNKTPPTEAKCDGDIQPTSGNEL